MPNGANLRIFKKGIKPTWEAPANTHGGRWVHTQCRAKGKGTDDATGTVLEVLLWLLGCQSSQDSSKLNGLVYSRRTQGTVLSLWNTNAKDTACVKTVRAELNKLLAADLKYKKHHTAPSHGSPRPSVEARPPEQQQQQRCRSPVKQHVEVKRPRKASTRRNSFKKSSKHSSHGAVWSIVAVGLVLLLLVAFIDSGTLAALSSHWQPTQLRGAD
eukprot:TRINITY_DN14560_c0_g1_i1.p2 TRINITY_DN14560_c0_g1~~TRINITY_DN14560_c0_g1_i1.p2  ORF type:complete len:214 (+),score=57.66 TRINITY_DN14560_c0_g1_i1:304-945(+)